MQGVRGRGHLPAPAPKGQVQGVLGGPLPARQRSKCMECREESDKSMPAGLEELEEAGV